MKPFPLYVNTQHLCFCACGGGIPRGTLLFSGFYAREIIIRRLLPVYILRYPFSEAGWPGGDGDGYGGDSVVWGLCPSVPLHAPLGPQYSFAGHYPSLGFSLQPLTTYVSCKRIPWLVTLGFYEYFNFFFFLPSWL